MEDKRRKPSLFGPLFLIFIGILFLLNNLGVVSWGIWFQLLRLWPLFLIGAGLDLLFGRRSMLGSLMVSLIVIALLAGGLWFIASRPAPAATVKEINYSLEDATSAQVEIGFSVGTLRIGALPESNDLVAGTAELSGGEELRQDFDVRGGKAYLTLKSEGSFSFPAFHTWDKEKTWDLRLNRDVPLALDVDTGVGDARLDLRLFNIDKLDLNAGVGRVTVILPERGQIEVNISGGVGRLVLEIPEGMEVRLHLADGLSNKNLPSGYRQEGDAYLSPGYKGAENQAEVYVSAGIGQVMVQQYRGE